MLQQPSVTHSVLAGAAVSSAALKPALVYGTCREHQSAGQDSFAVCRCETAGGALCRLVLKFEVCLYVGVVCGVNFRAKL